MHVRREKKQNITITSKSSAVLLMPRTTWFTAFVRCNTKHIYKSKIKSKKKLNCVKEACNQSVEFHNGSGRNEQQTSSNLKWLKTVFKHSNQLSSECSKTNFPSTYSNNSHTYWPKDCWYIMSMLLGNSVKQFLGTASVNPW